jgi:hypothetical protein
MGTVGPRPVTLDYCGRGDETMNGLPGLILILVTALLSSVLTLLLALAWWQWFLRKRLEARAIAY